MWNEKEYMQDYYKTNLKGTKEFRESCRLATAKWRKENREKSLQASRNWIKNYPEKHLLRIAKRRAKAQNREFSIELTDIAIPEFCPYLGIKLEILGEKFNSPSIDRIDNTKGYTKGNIEIISFQANAMKSVATREQLITFSKSVLRRYEV